MNARLFRYVSVGAMLALSLGSALPTRAAPPKPVSPAGPAQTSGPGKSLLVPSAPASIGGAIYDSIPSPVPPNVPSQPFQAQQTTEFGDQVSFAGGGRLARKVTVLMSTWAPQAQWPGVGTLSGWIHPITFNIYAVNPGVTPTIGSLLGTVTQNINIPWRPVTDPTCLYPALGGWRAGDGNCYNGFAFTIEFDLTALNLVLPNQIIYGIAYNTQTYGTPAIGSDGPYNSLNVGLKTTGGPTTGTDVNPDAVFWNTITAANYTDGGASGVGIFRQDTGWAGYVPAVRFEAASADLRFAPVTTLVPVGAQVPIDMLIGTAGTPIGGLSGYQFDVNYNKNVLNGYFKGAYVNSFFDTVNNAFMVPPTPVFSDALGLGSFGGTKTLPPSGPRAAYTGWGTLGSVSFTATNPGVSVLSFTKVKFSDTDATPILVTSSTATVTVYGFAIVNGTVKLQGRTLPYSSSGPVKLVDTTGILPPVSTTYDVNTGAFSVTVQALAAGTQYSLTADHSLYLTNTKLLTVTPGLTFAQPTTTLRAGDADESEKVTVTDLTCIGGAFGMGPTPCGSGNSDINDDGIIDIFDLVLAGGNYDLAGPRPW